MAFKMSNLNATELKMYSAVLLGSIGMDHVIIELCSIGTILLKNYMKMTMLIFIEFFVKY